MRLKRIEKTGFTLVEILTVLAIIALLVGLLVPSLSMARRLAKEVKQKAQLAAIDVCLTAFRNDYGVYPPSSATGLLAAEYGGAQKLAEALVGWDLMGFHPLSGWRADGLDINGGRLSYDPPPRTRGDATLYERKGRYIELEMANAFKVGALFDLSASPGNPLAPNTYVLCDVFGAIKVNLGGKTVLAGAPILYYRANTASKTISSGATRDRIYDFSDNHPIVLAKDAVDPGTHPLADGATFYTYITDPKVSGGVAWPYRPDSYLLITAGNDGLYGTSDDIRNFGN